MSECVVTAVTELVPVLDLRSCTDADVCARLTAGCTSLGFEAACVDGCLGELMALCDGSCVRLASLNDALMQCRLVRDGIDDLLPTVRRRVSGVDDVPSGVLVLQGW